MTLEGPALVENFVNNVFLEALAARLKVSLQDRSSQFW